MATCLHCVSSAELGEKPGVVCANGRTFALHDGEVLTIGTLHPYGESLVAGFTNVRIVWCGCRPCGWRVA